MSEVIFSFFDCCDISQEKIITVGETAHSGYTYLEHVARRFKRWITVRAEALYRTVIVRAVTAFRYALAKSGVSILRQSAILRF